MAQISRLKMPDGNTLYPVTSSDAIMDTVNNESLSTTLSKLGNAGLRTLKVNKMDDEAVYTRTIYSSKTTVWPYGTDSSFSKSTRDWAQKQNWLEYKSKTAIPIKSDLKTDEIIAILKNASYVQVELPTTAGVGIDYYENAQATTTKTLLLPFLFSRIRFPIQHKATTVNDTVQLVYSGKLHFSDNYNYLIISGGFTVNMVTGIIGGNYFCACPWSEPHYEGAPENIPQRCPWKEVDFGDLERGEWIIGV